jgi:hypothetical protein
MGYAVKLQSRRPNESIILAYGKNGSVAYSWSLSYINEKYVTAETISGNARNLLITFKKAFKNVVLSYYECTFTKTSGNFTIEPIVTKGTYNELMYNLVSIKPQDQFTIVGTRIAWTGYALYG